MIKKYIEINLASPEKILKWTERVSINGKLVGEVKNSMLRLLMRLKLFVK
jgi:hypothetical protein